VGEEGWKEGDFGLFEEEKASTTTNKTKKNVLCKPLSDFM